MKRLVILAALLCGCTAGRHTPEFAHVDELRAVPPTGPRHGIAPEHPRDTANRLDWSDFRYVGSVRLKDRAVFRHLDVAALAWDPTSGQLLVGSKGGIRKLDRLPAPVQSKDPTRVPEVDIDQSVPAYLIAAEVTALTNPAGTLNGMTIGHDGRLWLAIYEFYNVAARDNLGLVSMAADWTFASDVRGAWRAGPAGIEWPCSSVPNLNCSGWIDPAKLDKFHANKTHQWVMKVPPTWSAKYGNGRDLAVGRQRGAGAFGGATGPALYAVSGDTSRPTGASLDAVPLVLYPTGSRSWSGAYRNSEKDGNVNAIWVWTRDGRSVFLDARSKGLGPSYYGPSRGTCSGSKGWHAEPYEPRIHLYDDDELGAVALGRRAPWSVQHFESASPRFLWRHPADGSDATCNLPWFNGMAYDPSAQTLYILQTKSHDPNGGQKWREGCVIHVVEVL